MQANSVWNEMMKLMRSCFFVSLFAIFSSPLVGTAEQGLAQLAAKSAKSDSVVSSNTPYQTFYVDSENGRDGNDVEYHDVGQGARQAQW